MARCNAGDGDDERGGLAVGALREFLVDDLIKLLHEPRIGRHGRRPRERGREETNDANPVGEFDRLKSLKVLLA